MSKRSIATKKYISSLTPAQRRDKYTPKKNKKPAGQYDPAHLKPLISVAPGVYESFNTKLPSAADLDAICAEKEQTKPLPPGWYSYNITYGSSIPENSKDNKITDLKETIEALQADLRLYKALLKKWVE